MSTDWISHVKNVQRQHGCSYKDALSIASKTYQGSGIVDDAVLTFKKAHKYVRSIINKRDEFPPSMRHTLQKYGNDKILSIEVFRNPLKKLSQFAGVLPNIKEFMAKHSYDELFHLGMNITLIDGTSLVFEKNEVLKLQPGKKRGEIMGVDKYHPITLNQFVDNTAKKMGLSRMINYTTKVQNCQQFVTYALKANGLLTPELNKFINQDIEDLFNNYLPKIAEPIVDTATDIASRVDVAVNGAGFGAGKKKIINI